MPQSNETQTQPKQPENRPSKQPEFKVGPLPGGLGVAVWRNTIQTEDGPRTIRSITIAPRRYRDPNTNEWRDAPSYRPLDIPVLVLALEKAFDFCQTVVLGDDQPPMKEVPPETGDNQDVPF